VDAYFKGVLASGRSSFCYLQNVYTTKNITEQGLSLALCLCESFFADGKGAFRVHGGGFAGTVQAYVPAERVDEFTALMDGAFGVGATADLRIRPVGAARLY
jgi:galactokinase